MEKRNLKVIVFPKDNVYPVVTMDDVRKVINGSGNNYNPEVIITHLRSAPKNFIPEITNHIKSGDSIDIMFWDRLPAEEMTKLMNYSVRNLHNVRLMSVVK